MDIQSKVNSAISTAERGIYYSRIGSKIDAQMLKRLKEKPQKTYYEILTEGLRTPRYSPEKAQATNESLRRETTARDDMRRQVVTRMEGGEEDGISERKESQ